METNTGPAPRASAMYDSGRRAGLTAEQVEFAAALGRVLAELWAAWRRPDSADAAGKPDSTIGAEPIVG